MQLELDSLQKRSFRSVGLIVSDGLVSIENAIVKSFPNAQHQLCVVDIKRTIYQFFQEQKD